MSQCGVTRCTISCASRAQQARMLCAKMRTVTDQSPPGNDISHPEPTRNQQQGILSQCLPSFRRRSPPPPPKVAPPKKTLKLSPPPPPRYICHISGGEHPPNFKDLGKAFLEACRRRYGGDAMAGRTTDNCATLMHQTPPPSVDRQCGPFPPENPNQRIPGRTNRHTY